MDGWTRRPPLSVLDLAIVNGGHTSAEALAATTALAERAEELGYHRFWVAEHHNMPLLAVRRSVGLLDVEVTTVAYALQSRLRSLGLLDPAWSSAPLAAPVDELVERDTR